MIVQDRLPETRSGALFKIRAPFIFDREEEAQGILRPNTLLSFMLGWRGWRYYISYVWQRCECGIFSVDGCGHCPKCCTCERGS